MANSGSEGGEQHAYSDPASELRLETEGEIAKKRAKLIDWDEDRKQKRRRVTTYYIVKKCFPQSSDFVCVKNGFYSVRANIY